MPGIDAYVALAQRHRLAEDRQSAIEDAMSEYLCERLRAHGWQGSDETMQTILGIDIELNAKGLVAWLDRQDKEAGN